MSIHFIDFVGYSTAISIIGFFIAKQIQYMLDMIPMKQVKQIVETVEYIESKLPKKKDKYEIKV